MLRILIVDDDEQTRKLIRERLEDTYDVFDTGDPENAFVMTLQHKPDAILLDLSMPKLSGFELCQTLSSLSFTQRIPIFIISGQDARNKAFCTNLGAVAYLEKPVDFGELRDRLAVTLNADKTERRAEVRVQLKLDIQLRGTDKDGKLFEVDAVTENMSVGGFLCSCTATLEEGTTLEAFLRSGNQYRLGRARVVHVRANDTALHPRYHFRFIEQGNGEAEKIVRESLQR
jgi:DNA-binding response OmpR family regulator